MKYKPVLNANEKECAQVPLTLTRVTAADIKHLSFSRLSITKMKNGKTINCFPIYEGRLTQSGKNRLQKKFLTEK